MRILFLGDVVGNVGCSKIIKDLSDQIKKNRIDALEELIVQLIFQVQKQSNNEWKANWSSV